MFPGFAVTAVNNLAHMSHACSVAVGQTPRSGVTGSMVTSTVCAASPRPRRPSVRPSSQELDPGLGDSKSTPNLPPSEIGPEPVEGPGEAPRSQPRFHHCTMAHEGCLLPALTEAELGQLPSGSGGAGELPTPDLCRRHRCSGSGGSQLPTPQQASGKFLLLA